MNGHISHWLKFPSDSKEDIRITNRLQNKIALANFMHEITSYISLFDVNMNSLVPKGMSPVCKHFIEE